MSKHTPGKLRRIVRGVVHWLKTCRGGCGEWYYRDQAYRLGRGVVNSPTEVAEPAGYTGPTLTPIPQGPFPCTFKRRGRAVYATKAEARAALARAEGRES